MPGVAKPVVLDVREQLSRPQSSVKVVSFPSGFLQPLHQRGDVASESTLTD